jgi:hypothetical protein
VLLLNVGGRIFHALRSTLLREPDSMLAKMFDSGTQFGELAADADGNPFIDRSADTFALILAYLRQSGRLIGARALSVEQLENLLEDAQYFGLEGLVAAVGDVVAEKNEAAEEFESKRNGEIIAAEKRGDKREKQRQRELAQEAERRQAARDGSRTYEYRKVLVLYDHAKIEGVCKVYDRDSVPSRRRTERAFRGAMKQSSDMSTLFVNTYCAKGYRVISCASDAVVRSSVATSNPLVTLERSSDHELFGTPTALSESEDVDEDGEDEDE